MCRFGLIFLLLFKFALNCDGEGLDSEGYFSLISSRAIYINQKYQYAIQRYNIHSDLIVELIGSSGRAAYTKTHTATVFENDDYVEDYFDVRKNDTYKIHVKLISNENGDDEIVFEQSMDLITVNKMCSIFLQTDRAIYKPNDVINYRMFVLDSELRPYNNPKGSNSIKIIDPTDVEVFIERKIRFKNGVFIGQFQLSEYPIYGNWTFHVQIDKEQEFLKTFEVKEYTLPHYELYVNVKPDISIQDEKIDVQFYAQYTFGDYVAGTACVTAKVYDPSYPENIKYEINKNVTLESRKIVEFTLKNDLKITNILGKSAVKIEVNFIDHLTGIDRNKEAQVKIHYPDEVFIELRKTQKYFKPGFTFSFDVNLKNYEGLAFLNTFDLIVVSVMHYYEHIANCDGLRPEIKEKEGLTLEQHYLPSNGTANVQIELPKNVTKIICTIEYMKNKKELRASRLFSASRQYMKLTIDDIKDAFSEMINVGVNFTSKVLDLNVIAIGRSGVVLRKRINFEEETDYYEYKFKPTFDMVPEINLIGYYLNTNGEIIFDHITINFMDNLPNFLNVSFDTTSNYRHARPGGNVSISVTSNAESQVFLLAIDKSAQLMATGYDIDRSTVFDDIARYQVLGKIDLKTTDENMRRYLDLLESNAVLITNAFNKVLVDTCLATRSGSSPNIGTKQMRIVNSLGKDEQWNAFDNDTHIEPFDATKQNIRKDFRETWIFEDFSTDDFGMETIIRKVPDTITNWVFTGFSLHPEYGIGIAKPKELTVFQPFFISAYLPQFAKVGEILKIPVSVFSYLKNPQNIILTFEKFAHDDFEFIKETQNADKCAYVATNEYKIEKIFRHEGRGSKVGNLFIIRLLVAGNIKIKISAKSKSSKLKAANDEIEKTLKVEHEGATTFRNEQIFIDLRNDLTFTMTSNIPRSEHYIPNSIKIEASASGDILGPALENLGNLINRSPLGTVDETLSKMQTNIFVQRYILATRKTLGKQFLEAIPGKITTGIQNLIKFRSTSKGLSFWGGGKGSTFLTAYVVRTLAAIPSTIQIDSKVIDSAFSFLIGRQAANGSFLEMVKSSDKSRVQLQSEFGLTLYTLIAFLENPNYRLKYKSVIDNGLQFMDINIHQLQTPYLFAIATYVYQLAKSPKVENIMKSLEHEAVIADKFIYWNNKLKQDSESASDTDKSLRIEIASYALLSYVEIAENKKREDAIKIMNWLVSQRNPRGGFYSTHDTPIGLQALSKIASVIYAPNTNMEITLNYHDVSEIFPIKPLDDMQLIKKVLPSSVYKYTITAHGTGLALFQLTYQFNAKLSKTKSIFNLNVTKRQSVKNILELHICTSLNSTSMQEKREEEDNDGYMDLEVSEANIVSKDKDMIVESIMEISLPTGFIYNGNTEALMESLTDIKQINIQKSKSIIIIHFNQLTVNEVCVDIKADRAFDAAGIKDAPVKVYEFMWHDNFASVYYQVEDPNKC